MHGEGTCKVASWFADRHQRYIYLIRDIHTYLIEGVKIRNELVEQADKERSPYAR